MGGNCLTETFLPTLFYTYTPAQAREIDGKYGLICADCLDVLKAMKDNAVDVVFTSPPYNDSGNEI